MQACLLCSPSPNQLRSNQDCFRNWSDGGSEWEEKIAISLQILFCISGLHLRHILFDLWRCGRSEMFCLILTVTDPRASTFCCCCFCFLVVFVFVCFEEKVELVLKLSHQSQSMQIHGLGFSCFSNSGASCVRISRMLI